MEINCNQFEGLITFYIDDDLSESLKQSFEEHLKHCDTCKMKFKVISSIIDDIKGAYDKILSENGYNNEDFEITEPIYSQDSAEHISELDLSAYIDNELPYEHNVKIRRNIIAKPKIRTKLEKMYNLRKILSDSFAEHKNIMKTDFSRNVIKSLNKEITPKEIYLHCAMFILIVVAALVISVLVILSVL